MSAAPTPPHSSQAAPDSACVVVSGDRLRAAIIAASGWLDTQVERLDALNVFPVPDGDTGTNMALTLRATAEGLRDLSGGTTASDVAQAAARAALLGARGNSGVILSQLLRGVAAALQDAPSLTAPLLADALTGASDAARKAVAQPVEGTILTAARESARAAADAASKTEDVLVVLESALEAAGLAVAATTSQMEVLARAGVVDSGAEGYRMILQGVWQWATGRSLADTAPMSTSAAAPVESLHEASDAPFGFCTEFLLRDCALPLSDVQSVVRGMGESVIVVGDQDLLRVHVHTLRPGQALDFAVDHGTLVRVKVVNMQLQHEAFAAKARQSPLPPQPTPPASSVGVFALVDGDGFARIYQSLGATPVSISAGAQGLLNAIDAASAPEAILLPNGAENDAAIRALEGTAGRAVRVVSTTSLAEGIAALLAFNQEAHLAENVASMHAATRAVHTIVLDSATGDKTTAGLVHGTLDGAPVGDVAPAGETLAACLARLPVESFEIVTIYWGRRATRERAEALCSVVGRSYPGLATELVEGGQNDSLFLVSVE